MFFTCLAFLNTYGTVYKGRPPEGGRGGLKIVDENGQGGRGGSGRMDVHFLGPSN